MSKALAAGLSVFIDGQAGTTGLQLEERLRGRSDLTLLEINPSQRKDPEARKALMDKADVVFLCLPDDEARKAVLLASPYTLVIDASTAHRTADGWVYGLPELSLSQRRLIATARRIAVPGCHAAGFISLVAPLVKSGHIQRGHWLHCVSITGYSGGGKAMIANYAGERDPDDMLHAPRPYALGLNHKHLPEMMAMCDLTNAPHFMPIVGDMAQGMLVNVPLWSTKKAEIWDALSRHYSNSHFIKVMPMDYETQDGFLDPTACNGTNNMELFVFGNDDQVLLAARHDNLGKGASGAAMQCMNIACGLDESVGF